MPLCLEKKDPVKNKEKSLVVVNVGPSNLQNWGQLPSTQDGSKDLHYLDGLWVGWGILGVYKPRGRMGDGKRSPPWNALP